jgi:hypothetical protein
MNNADIEFISFDNIEDVIDMLLQKLSLQNDDYESVKFYGDFDIIIMMLRCILGNKKYTEISVASIDVTSSEIDSVCKSDYVLIITDDKELYIQSAWNGDILFSNNAKFTICCSSICMNIVSNVMHDNTPIVIASIK